MSIDASCRRLTYRPWFKRHFVIGGPWLYQARELEFAAHLDSGRSTILTWPIHFTRREVAHDQFHNTPDLQPTSGNPGLRRHSLTWYCGIDAVRNRHINFDALLRSSCSQPAKRSRALEPLGWYDGFGYGAWNDRGLQR